MKRLKCWSIRPAIGSLRADSKLQGKRVNYLVEVCDPSEAAEHAYSCNGILVSDFYTPNYFDPVKAGGVRYSFTGAITEPLQVLLGGYLSWQDPRVEFLVAGNVVRRRRSQNRPGFRTDRSKDKRKRPRSDRPADDARKPSSR